MFASANEIARLFTFPLVISWRQFNGKCSATAGALVIINDEGWFVTTYHILKYSMNLNQSNQEYQRLMALRSEIENDGSLSKGAREGKLRQIKIAPEMVTHHSIWFGGDGLEVGQTLVLPEIDLAVGKINNFRKEMVSAYPKFKDPGKPMPPGRSLCKLGYPFPVLEPIFHESKNAFEFQAGSFPPPFFPIDGIFTRRAMVAEANTPQNPRSYPLAFLETSSPGLRGQSGGPIFDVEGNIWAIQSQTSSYPLNLESNVNMKPKEREHLENQFFNVGMGIQSETIIGFLKENQIPFELSQS